MKIISWFTVAVSLMTCTFGAPVPATLDSDELDSRGNNEQFFMGQKFETHSGLIARLPDYEVSLWEQKTYDKNQVLTMWHFGVAVHQAGTTNIRDRGVDAYDFTLRTKEK
jgi:hypothetical protein